MTKDPVTKNNSVLKLQGKAEIPENLEIGTNYEVHIKGSITAVTESDNNDGSHTLYHKFEPVFVEVITEMGKSIKAKDPRRNSAKIRNYLFKAYFNEGYTEDFDSVYDAFTLEVMLMTPQLLRGAIKRLQS